MGKTREADFLVCYDIRNPIRLRRVHRCMRGWGMPVQYSVFYCRLTMRLCQALARELDTLIDPMHDDIRIYSMQSKGTIHFQGRRPFPEGMIIEGPWLHEDENVSQL